MSTITVINSTDDLETTSRAAINANFAALNTDKIENLAGLGITATAAELNYCSGVTSAIQTQLNAKAATNQTFYIGTTQVAINRASAALTLAGITLTTPDIGTPSSGTLTNCTGLPVAGLVALTASEIVGTDANGFLVSLAVATYPSLTELTYVKGVTSAIQTQLGTKVTSGGALGTPSSGTLTNCTGLPLTGLTSDTTTALGVGSINLGHATDTTIARSGAGVVTIEGVEITTLGNTTTGTGSIVRATSPTFVTQITTPLIYGDSAANGDITIEGTSHATKTTSCVFLQPTGGNIGIRTTDPVDGFDIAGGITSANGDGYLINLEGYINHPVLQIGEYQNYLQQTEVFSNSSWVKTLIGTVTNNSSNDPRGTALAENIPAGSDSTASLSQAVTDSTTGNWTFSVWLKTQSGTATIALRIDSNEPQTGTEKNINLTTAWKRYSVTQNITGGTTRTVYIVSGTNAISAWGAQLEPSSRARVYSGAITTTPITALARSSRISSSLEILGGFSNSSTFTNTRSGITTTSTDGTIITNNTASTSGVPVQMSPRLRLSGTVWDTGASASRTTNFINETLPISGNPGTAALTWSYDYNAGGYSELMRLNSAGNLSVVGTLDLGNSTDTTISRSAAGVIAVEGVVIPSISSTNTLTNKRINPRESTETSNATPTPNSDTTDIHTITAQAAAATFGVPTGTPVQGQKLIIRIKDNGTARALSWNAIYRASSDLALPTTTTLSKTLYCGFIYNSTDSKWDLIAKLDNF